MLPATTPSSQTPSRPVVPAPPPALLTRFSLFLLCPFYVAVLTQGQFRSSVRCTACNYESVTFSPFLFLSVPIPRGSNNVTLKACLKQFSQSERVTGQDTWYYCLLPAAMWRCGSWDGLLPTRSDGWLGIAHRKCPRCNMHREAVKSLGLWRLPPVLIIHLKRFTFEGPFRDKLQTHVCDQYLSTTDAIRRGVMHGSLSVLCTGVVSP